MVHERQYIFLRLNLVIDMLVSMAALVAAYYLRSSLSYAYISVPDLFPAWFPEIVPYEESHLLKEYIWLFPTCAILWPLALNRLGYYDLYDLRQAAARRWMIIKASVFSTVFLVLLIFVFKQQFIARIVVVGTGICAALFLMAKETFMRSIFIHLHKRPEYQHNIVVIGETSRFSQAEELITRYSEWGLRITKALDISRLVPESLADELTRTQVDEVVFAVAPESYRQFPSLAQVCEKLGLKTRLLMDVYSPEICNVSIEEIEGLPVLTLNPTTQNFGALTVKLFADRIISLLLLILLSPVLLLIGLLVKVTSAGPVVISQKRCGLNGKPFMLYKFRSMVKDADRMKESLDIDNEMKGWAFKIKNDPRITPFGRFLRRFSLDELLQLWNVLKGDMSLVGPRPALPAEVSKFKLWERRRLSMKPGMTGLWQVSGRNLIPNEEWVNYDLKYIDTWSLGLDIRVLIKTAWTVLTGEGM
jgi:exopolysaccharide biosynthesis polyprenyl glycosylphosphotransferase